jgi:hypothetical protein
LDGILINIWLTGAIANVGYACKNYRPDFGIFGITLDFLLSNEPTVFTELLVYFCSHKRGPHTKVNVQVHDDHAAAAAAGEGKSQKCFQVHAAFLVHFKKANAVV